MSNIGGGIRALIVADGVVSGRAWADDAPDKPTFPYVTIDSGISVGPDLEGDGGDVEYLVREEQVNLWQKADDEDDDVVRRLRAAVNGKRIPGAATRLRVRDTVRLYERDTRIVHHALTLAVRHDPTGL